MIKKKSLTAVQYLIRVFFLPLNLEFYSPHTVLQSYLGSFSSSSLKHCYVITSIDNIRQLILFNMMLLIPSFGYSQEDGAGNELGSAVVRRDHWSSVETASGPCSCSHHKGRAELRTLSSQIVPLTSILCLCVFVSVSEQSKARVHKLLVRVVKVSIYYCKIFKSIQNLQINNCIIFK